MKNKGFTLIELLAIIIILSTISVMSFASLTTTLEKSKETEQKTFENNIVNAAKLYMVSNIDKYENMDDDDFTATITTIELIGAKYLKQTIDNPSNTDIRYYYVKVTKDSEGILQYEVLVNVE